MPIADAIPTIVSARILDRLQADTVFAARTSRNYQRELSYGDRIDVVPVTGGGGVTDVPQIGGGTDLTYTAVTAGSPITLVVDQRKYWAVEFDDQHQVQSRPMLLDAAVREKGEDLAAVQDAYVRTLMNATTHAIYVNPNAQGDSAQAVGLASVSNAEVQHIQRAFATMGRYLNQQGSMGDRWAIVQPHTMELLVRIFASDGTYRPPAESDSIRNGFSGRLLGFTLYEDARTSVTVTAGAATETIFFGTDMATEFVEQLANTERLRSQESFADRVRGQSLYGGVLLYPALVAKATISLTEIVAVP